MVDDDDSFAELFNIPSIVRGKEYGCLLFLIEPLDQLSDLQLRTHIQANSGFVQEDDFWPVQYARQFATHALTKRGFSPAS